MDFTHRKVYFPLLICFALVLGADEEVSGADALQRVRIAYASRSDSAMPQYVAQDKGFFKAAGLETELIQMNPRIGATAVVNGDVTFATPFVSTFRGTVQGLAH